jgi:hypothetical protein
LSPADIASASADVARRLPDLLNDPRSAATEMAKDVAKEIVKRGKKALGDEVPRRAPGQWSDLLAGMNAAERDIARGGGGFSEGMGGTGNLPNYQAGFGVTGPRRITGDPKPPDGGGNPRPLTQRERDEAKYNQSLAYIQQYNPLLAQKLKGSITIPREPLVPISSTRFSNQVKRVQHGVAGHAAYRDVFRTTFK